MAKLGGTESIRLIADGQEMTADTWSLDVTTEQIDITSYGDAVARYAPGPQHVTIELTGVRGGFTTTPPAPREDIVTHLGARCCCRHCPEGGDHA